MTVAVRTDYGWSGDGKTAAEIASDIRHTRHRLDADVRALRAKLTAPARVVPLAALGLAAVVLLIRSLRRR
jgi:DNA-binding CsgD family transcriptional regulator